MRTIAQIDKDINAIRRQMRRLEKIDTGSAASWQAAWNKHPDLHEQEKALFCERGEAQKVRDQKAYEKAMRVQRRENAKFRKESAAKFKARQALEAAAPDLLEMTKLLVRVAEYEIRRRTAEGDEEGARMTMVTLNLARAAVAKATAA